MNHLKKIEDRVISILKTNVDARSDDMMLYLLVCNSFYSNENSVGKMPFEVVMSFTSEPGTGAGPCRLRQHHPGGPQGRSPDPGRNAHPGLRYAG